jgi:7,8-dihydropterin-6-yl-methyl-4-(beta-D-ribofuranosyl)aminobenzene 5'-phosphate synthase
MVIDISRREFLNATAATGIGLVAQNFLQEHAMAQSPVLIPEAERITITVLADNLVDTTRPNEKIAIRAARGSSATDNAMHGEHGLAYLIETTVGGAAHAGMFDFGSDGPGVLKNMGLLKIDLSKIEAMAISHDHWDHQAALLDILKARKSEFRSGIPLYVGEHFFEGTYSRQPNGNMISLTSLKREELEALGVVKVVQISGPTSLIPGAYLPGRVERVTDYEKIAPSFVAKKGDEVVPETFTGEQALVLNAKGKGLIVLSACAHRGIVNTVRHAQKMTGIDKVHMVMGGFHMTGARPEIIQKVVADIKAVNPDYVVPTHCTGFETIAAFAKEMPNQFILNTTGTKYIIA